MKPAQFFRDCLLAITLGIIFGILLADWSAEESTFQQPRSK